MERLRIGIDRTSPVPLYFQVSEQIEAAIRSGALEPGEKIDNEVALASELGLSRPTMRQAIQTLVNKGLLTRRRGVGTVVVHSKIRRSVGLTSLFDDLAEADQHPRSLVLTLEETAPEETVAEELGLGAEDRVWFLRRLRLVGDEPLAVMSNYIPVKVADLTSFDLERDGLYASLRAIGVQMHVARQRIGARRALGDEPALLNQRRGDPLLTMNRTAYLPSGEAVEYSAHVYRPDLYSFETTLVEQ